MKSHKTTQDVQRRRYLWARSIVLSMIVALAFSAVGVGLFAAPRSSTAQVPYGPPAPVVVVANPIEKVYDAIKRAVKLTADVAFKNTLRAFLNKVAYDSAVYIASGGKGQKPLFYTQPGKVLEDVGDAAVGDYLDRLSVSVFGQSLCEPINLQTKVRLTIFAQKAIDPGSIEGRCTIDQIGRNLDESYRRVGKQQLIDFSYNFNPEANEFGAYLRIQGDLLEARARAEEEERNKTLFSGFKAVTSPISGLVKTPSNLVESGATIPLEQAFQGYTQQTGSPIADAVGTFTNTLVSKLLQRIFQQGYNPQADSSAFANLNSRGGGIATAKSIFAKIAQPDYVSGGSLDIITELSSCPSNPQYNNCIIDNRFAQAIQQKLTVREAVEAGLLDGNKTFGFDSEGREPEYLNGYPYRSLVMLRKYRILPVGWEIAAQYIRDFSQSSFSLTEVMDKYNLCGQNVCSNDNDVECTNDLECPDTTGDGTSDGTCDVKVDYSPFCGLVDPDWTLKSPEVFCKREGAGENVITQTWTDHDSDSALATQGQKDAADVTPNEREVTRQPVCVDEQTCIVENPDGTCQRYGYCTEEQDVWRFSGQSCNEQYASCQTFVRPDGGQVSYLQNTIDRNGCDASNAGCQWYCQEKNAAGNFSCDYGLSAAGQNNRLAFDRDASTCDASAAGCAEFIRTKAGLGTNLVANSSFELFDRTVITDAQIDDDADDRGPALSSYDMGNSAHPLDVTKDAYDGQYAIKMIDNPGEAQTWYAPHSTDTGRPLARRTFTFSYHAKLDSCTNASITSVDSNVHIVAYSPDNYLVSSPVTYTLGEWKRYSVTGTGSPTETRTALQGIISVARGCTIVIDAIQLEEDAAPSAYKGYGTVNATYLNGSRKTCSFDDVGCELYTPLASGSPVTGKVTDPSTCDPNDPLSCDQCPAAYVGCKAFREMPVEHTPRRAAVEPVSFVPSTGKSCPATQVGCEEYTNLDEVARGGEGKEYYSFIRQCAKPEDAGANAQNYYTWVGDQESGYQLKQFRLIQSNITEPTGNRAPCTNIGPDLGGTGITDYPNCVDEFIFNDDDVPATLEAHPRATCEGEYPANPDCAEVYDASGNITYRLRSRLIFVSDDCHPFKNTIDTAAGRNATYHMIPGQSLSCSESYAGCREYKGSAGTNTRRVLFSDFENGSIAPWISNADSSLNPSNAAAQAGGHSMIVFPLPGGAATVVDTLIEKNQSYILSFWAAGGNNDVSIEAALYDSTGTLIPNTKFSGTAVAKSGDWNQYALGPLFVSQDIPAGTRLFIGGTSTFTIDNILLEEVTDDIFRVKDSYTKCSGYENCAAYRDRDNQISFLKSFTKICSSDVVGCEAMIQTQNSSNPFTQSVQVTDRDRGDYNSDRLVDSEDVRLFNSYFNGRCTTGPLANTSTTCDPTNAAAVCGAGETCRPGINQPDPLAIMDVNGSGSVTAADVSYLSAYVTSGGPAPIAFPQSIALPADQLVAVVNDPAVKCEAAQAGCTEMGKPVIGSDNAVTGYTGAYIVNDPDTYANTLCQQEESSCQEYSTGEGFAYFKDPGNATCQYYAPTGSSTAGWFISGTNIGCGPQLTSTSISEGLVGTCPAEQSGCTEYLDPLSPKGCDVNVPAGVQNAGRCNAASGVQSGAFCDASAYCQGGLNAGKACDPANPIDVCGTGGSCVLASNQCGTGTCEPIASCTANYYISDTVDTQSCNGVVNENEGCRLVYNTNKAPATYYAKGTGRGSVPSGACDNNPLTPATPDCDSNELVKVQRDRVCNKWLECQTGTTVKNARGEEEQACFQRTPCNKLDPITGACIGFKACSDTGAACSRDADCIEGICTDLDALTPESVCTGDGKTRCTSNANCAAAGGNCVPVTNADLLYTSSDSQQTNTLDRLQNLSGLSKVGVNWGQVNFCSNNPKVSCTSSADCGGEPCGLNRIVEGYYPYASMFEVGISGAASSDLVTDGDFWDSNFLLSNTIRPNHITTQWDSSTSYRGWSAIGDDTRVSLVERADDGSIPGTPQLNENNVLAVDPGDDSGDGITYDLGNRILDGVEYTVSLKHKYEEGGATASDSIDIEFRHLGVNGNIVGTNFLGTVVGGTSWREYVTGSITSSKPLGTAKTLLAIIHRPGSGRTFYLDDVSLKPVLEIHSGANLGLAPSPDKITRGCRMYPKDDSTLCEYTDYDGISYRGWKGYCVEKDPKNPEVCINWWPVDILSGETSVFGQEQQAGYADRTPLYYCESGKGNTDRSIAPVRDWWCSAHGGDLLAACDATSPLGGLTTTSTSATGYVSTLGSFKVRSGGEINCQGNWTWDGHCEDQGGSDTPIQPNTPATGYDSTIEVDVDIKETDIENAQLVFTRDFNERWPLLVFSLDKVRGNVKETTSRDFQMEYQYTRLTETIGGTSYDIWRAYPTGANCRGGDSGYDCLWIDLLFNASTKRLQWVRAIGEDDTGNDDELGEFNINFYLREPCTRVVQVADGQSVFAWSDRVSSGSGYSTVGTAYTYASDLAPFGATPPLIGSPETWYGKELGTPLYVQVPLQDAAERARQTRAGLPYVCGDGTAGSPSCNTAVCLGGDTTVNGSACNTVETQKNCESKGGYCSGIFPPVTVNSDGQATSAAVTILKRLFVTALGGWRWDTATNAYVADDADTVVTAWQSDYQNMTICNGNSRPAFDGSGADYCAVQPVIKNFAITINGKEYQNDAASGTWNITDIPVGSTIKMTFTANVDKEQMPLDAILVDWDGDDTTSDDRAGSMAWGFAPRTDPRNPHTFFYTVTAPGTYQPRVQVMDHWATCSSITPVATRSASCAGDVDDNPGWYAFNGTIEVE